VVADFKELLKMFFTQIGADRAEERAQWVVDFEKGFAHAYPEPAEFRSRFSSNTYVKRNDFLRAYANLDLQNFVGRVPLEVPIRDIAPESLKFLVDALQNMPLDQLKSVVLVHSLVSKMTEGYPEFYAANRAFSARHLGGAAQRSPRDEECTSL